MMKKRSLINQSIQGVIVGVYPPNTPTQTHTPTISPTHTPTDPLPTTNTPTHTPTSPSPDTCRELLSNGDFETGDPPLWTTFGMVDHTAQPRVDQTWLCLGGALRDLPKLDITTTGANIPGYP